MQATPSSYVCGSIILSLFLALLGCQKNTSGVYAGTCYNLTHNKKAEISLLLHERDGSIQGNLTIDEPLSGGGPFRGQIVGNKITFTTTDPYMGELTWTGVISGKRIEGTYEMKTNAIMTVLTGSSTQHGTWSAQR